VTFVIQHGPRPPPAPALRRNSRTTVCLLGLLVPEREWLAYRRRWSVIRLPGEKVVSVNLTLQK
jgi:hypothetical protein